MRDKWRHLAVEAAACSGWRVHGGGGRDRTLGWTLSRRPGPGLVGHSVERVVCATLQQRHGWRHRCPHGMNRPCVSGHLGPFIKLVEPNPTEYGP